MTIRPTQTVRYHYSNWLIVLRSEQTPDNIVFARELKLPDDLMFGRTRDQLTATEDFLRKLEERLFHKTI